jgi:hypothetical protein
MIHKKIVYHSRLISTILCLSLVLLQVLNAAPLTAVPDDQICQEKLDQAEEKYYNGELEQSIELARQCLEHSSLSSETRVRAYKILARSYLNNNESDLAKKTVISLLQIDPDYIPTIEEESPRFVDLVANTRAEHAQQQAAQEAGGISPWIWIGAGGAAAAAVIVIVAGGSGDDQNKNTNQSLPTPPMLP